MRARTSYEMLFHHRATFETPGSGGVFSRVTFTEIQFVRGMIRAIMEDERSMESILRELREIVANGDGPEAAPDPSPPPMPEDVARAIRE